MCGRGERGYLLMSDKSYGCDTGMLRREIPADADMIITQKRMRAVISISIFLWGFLVSCVVILLILPLFWSQTPFQGTNLLCCMAGIAAVFVLISLWFRNRQVAKLDVVPPYEVLDRARSNSRRWRKLYKKYTQTGEICPIKIEYELPVPTRPVLSCWRKVWLSCKRVILSILRHLCHYFGIIVPCFSSKDSILLYQSMLFVLSRKEFHADVRHNAIVICPSSGFKPEYFIDGPEMLVEFFSTHQIPYKVYLPQSREEFLQIIKNKNAAALWLFGHGTVGSFAITLSESVLYADLIGTDLLCCRKTAVHQLHCNGKNWISPYSLSYLLVDGWDFHEKGLQDREKNRAYVKYVLDYHERFPGIWQ